jgi:hypothetical protein
MNAVTITLAGAALRLLPCGALHWPAGRLLCVSDLHLGKSERMARRSGTLVPPYDGAATLDRLDAAIAATEPAVVVCLGDSFDDMAAAEALEEAMRLRLARLMAGRDWIWIEGNHDPGPLDLGGRHLSAWAAGPLVFRHVAGQDFGEISGHYHPKARVGRVRRACFATDGRRLILPAYGAYTGGLDTTDPALQRLLAPGATAVLTGPTMARVPIGGAACRSAG